MVDCSNPGGVELSQCLLSAESIAERFVIEKRRVTISVGLPYLCHPNV